jgi:hypothetical protein
MIKMTVTSVFGRPPAKTGNVTTARFHDTCGNLIGLHQVD